MRIFLGFLAFLMRIAQIVQINDHLVLVNWS